MNQKPRNSNQDSLVNL